jgi:hypothetical protein
MNKYSYTVFDDDPFATSGTAWWDHSKVEFESDSDDTAADHVWGILEREGGKCVVGNDYSPGDRIYALVWHEDGGLVDKLSYEIEADV